MYEHLRGDLRNQIPKFQNPSGPIQLTQEQFKMLLAKIPTGNPYIDLNSGQQITIAPQPNLQQKIENNWQQFLHTDNMGNPIPKEQWGWWDQQKFKSDLDKNEEDEEDEGDDGTDGGDGKKKSKFKQFFNKALKGVGSFIGQNADQIANMGMTAVNSIIDSSNIKQPGFMKGLDTTNNLLKMSGLDNTAYGKGAQIGITGIKALGALTAKNIGTYTADLGTKSRMGGSYADTYTNISEAERLSRQSYAFGIGAGSAQNKKNKAMQDESIIQGIDRTSQDQLAMSGNNLNYLRYQASQNGGWNPSLIRSSKFGSKLERIRRITSKKLEEPVEEFAEDLWEPQLFKEGGNIEENIEEDVFLEDSWEPQLFQNGGKTKYSDLAKEYYSDYDLSNINIIEDKQPRAEGNNIYVSSDEDVIHELWHVLSNNKPNELYKQFYDSLNDNRIIELGGDLDFVKRTGDPNVFYHPSEIEARIKAAKYKTKGQNYTKDFFKELRNNENKYGYNMRDLLHMYNDENLEKIFNLKTGGNLPEQSSEQEETNQKNIIPEGALHKEKHHMENAEDLTKKGIPVIDNNGEQQAEIERDEIVFTLEVTKKLEDLYHKYYDQETSKKNDLAIEAGKILVYEILYNTIDKTGLISKCKEGGKLNET